ncbi:diaminopimelate epimerase [Candidatus Clostridium stratigraminis]|uniref:Diaminopimelate epimerase n=1 Tax=Candidatus Clostridium stratigraminis TaxID=3381661 RepID=A0ABW8T2T1_9CLOT
MKFTKMHGNGNDFIVIEDLDNKLIDERSLAKRLCHRNFSIGADGILIVRKSSLANIKMTIINSDGSIANMCGNGIRCFAKYVWEHELVEKKDSISIETDDGVKTAYLIIDKGEVIEVTINMGMPTFAPADIPVISDKEILKKKVEIENKNYEINSVLLGVPHTIIFGKLEDFLIGEGKAIEKYKIFPKGTNVNFCEVTNKNRIRVMTWERGAGATLACGTGSSASVVVANKLGLVENKVTVEIPGGTLYIEITENGIYMTGPAVTSFIGEYII